MIDIPEKTLRLAMVLSKDIDDLGLSTRTYNALYRWGLRNIADVYEEYTSGRIKKVANLGPKSLIEIEHMLEMYLSEFRAGGEQNESN